MSWWDAIPAGLLLLLLFYVPGLAVLSAARLKGLLIFAAAPAVSVGVLGLAAIAAAPLGLHWNLLVGIAATSVSAIVALLFATVGRWKWRTIGPGNGKRDSALIGIGLVLSLPLSVLPIKYGMDRPDIPALTWDSVYHHSAIRWILETGNGSSLALGAIGSDLRSPRYYPGGWHDVLSLGVLNEQISVSINMSAIILACIIWPISMTYLVQCCFPNFRAAFLITPILAAGFLAFPARMISYGTLWPTALGLAFVPVLIGITVFAIRDAGHVRPKLRFTVVMLTILAGTGLAHPTGIFSWLYLSAPLISIYYLRRIAILRRSGRRGPLLRLIAIPVVIAGSLVVAIFSVPAFRTVFGFQSQGFESGAQAMGEAIFDAMLGPIGHGNTQEFWVMGLLALLGSLRMLAYRQHRWIAVTYYFSIALYMIAAGQDSFLRPIVGFWYSDPVRLGGLVPIFTIVIAVYSIVNLSRWLLTKTTTLARSGRDWGGADHLKPGGLLPVSTAIFLVVVMLAGTNLFRADVRQDRLEADYVDHLGWAQGLVGWDELQMLRNLDETLPPDAKIVGDPTSGAAFAYAMSGIPTVFSTLSGSWSSDARYLGNHFNDLGFDQNVCRLIEERGITHFYDDDARYLPDIVHRKDMEGLTTIDIEEGSLKLVESAGTARIFEIEACSSDEG
ncbi:hypothetical protein GC088_10130 [Arthrobacter sp. JZ12]|uniref:DUF6541 family protein n=1 Tax=Arthrobacter sp. JZ12 TaxID=2654190 RepID=UPI002B4A2C08|nr:DUF6541 family protein [Arthrobacter sp. JZ12]WRH25385.1 hypothetical protein GC088_10130 [Arthrobacter sp. JZ12]